MQREAIAPESGATWRDPPRRGAYVYAGLLLALVAGVAAWSLWAVWPFTIDDAGISYAYAKHIAEGHGPVAVVGGPRIEGYSNPLWVLLLVPVHWLGLPIPVLAKLLGSLLFASALLAGVSYIQHLEGRAWRAFGASAAGFVLVCVSCLEVAVWVPAGLENALFAALLLGMIALDTREHADPTLFGSSGLCAFGLSITRPEAALYAAGLLLLKLSAWRQHERRRQVLTALLAFAVPFVLYHAGHFLVFGELLPNTYRAKPGGGGWQKGLEYLLATARASALLYAVPLALLGLYGRPRLKLLAAWAWLAGLFFVLYSGGDWMPHGRFLSLFAPVVVLLAALGLGRLALVAAWLSRARLPREPAALALAAAACAAWLGYQLPRLSALRRTSWCHFCERVADTQRLQQLAARAALPSHSLVTHDFGGPSWLSDEAFYPIDFLGLCDRSIVLIRGRRTRGGVRDELRFYQYLLHEQPVAPSWVLVPPNFWPGFDRSPEYRSDFYALEASQLPRARRDSFFALHRGELVDYFPPLPTQRRALTPQLDLLGSGIFAGSPEGDRAVPGARVGVLLSLVPQGRLLGTEQLALRVEAGAQSAESPAVRLDRGIEGVAQQLAAGEPLRVELAVALPPGPAEAYRLSLVLSHGSSAQRRASARPPTQLRVVAPLGELAAAAPLERPERSLPRYPAALPAPTQNELRQLRPAVARSIELARDAGRAALADVPLRERLTLLGQNLEAQGQAEQAYLAYVWATQVDRSAWAQLAESVFRLRPASLGDEQGLQLALLRRYYASGASSELARLVAFYLASGRTLEAEYFLQRWPTNEADNGDPLVSSRPRLEAALHAGAGAPSSAVLSEVAVDPLGGSLDFEASGLQGWEGALGSYRAGPVAAGRAPKGLRGVHAAGWLASTVGGAKARGALLSPAFPLSGRVLSLLVGGGSAKQKVGVELLVDDQVVQRASGNDSDSLTPVFWNVAAFAGKTARLRVVDRSNRHYVLVDRVLIWR